MMTFEPPKDARFRATYPYVSFRVEYRQASRRVWSLLGEIAAMSRLMDGTAVRPAVRRELRRIAFSKGAQATAAIEGNTLTEEEVRQIVDGTTMASPSRKHLHQEIESIVRLFREAAQLRESGGQRVSIESICYWNRQLITGTVHEEEATPGVVRKHNITVGRAYRPPEHKWMMPLLQTYVRWLEQSFGESELGEIESGVLKAILAHLYFAWIHPFGDGNGRTARHIEYVILVNSGVPIECGHSLSNHYNMTRNRYYAELTKAQTNVFGFVEYALEGMRDQLREQLALIRDEQFHIAWEHYIHSTFRDQKPSPAQKRRRQIALSVPDKFVDREELWSASYRLAESYAKLGPRQFTRDLAALDQLGLIERKGDKFRANSKLMYTFEIH